MKLFSKAVRPIRKATAKDLDAIMDIVWRTIMLLQSEGNDQWDNKYPSRDDFSRDIAEGTLYVCEMESTVVGFICCNRISPKEHASVPWHRDSATVLILHRFAVSPKFHRRGIGTSLMRKADELAAASGCTSIRTDTNSLNLRMQALFLSCGYEKVGEIFLRGKTRPFYCYEKLL